MQRMFETPHAAAAASNAALIANVEKRATSTLGVLGPCLNSYKTSLESGEAPHPLHNLSRHLTSTLPATERSIRERMTAKWAGHDEAAERIVKSVTNSLRRSAGTNYQALVGYALARFLIERESAWYLEHPVPKWFGESLSIRFTGGVPPAEDDADPAAIDDGAEDVDEVGVTVAPDVDILLRNAAWVTKSAVPEPVLLLSVKTSLADRAGAAARWKTYFDLVTKPCPHVQEVDCAYRHLGIELAYAPDVQITHGIVTANIYKMNSDPYFAENGELRTGQARANTFMFDLRYSTRNDSEQLMAEGWEPLTALPNWLAGRSRELSLPP